MASRTSLLFDLVHKHPLKEIVCCFNIYYNLANGLEDRADGKGFLWEESKALGIEWVLDLRVFGIARVRRGVRGIVRKV